MILPIAVFLVVYFFIATELLDKTIASLIGAAVMIGLGLVPYTAEQAAEQYHAAPHVAIEQTIAQDETPVEQVTVAQVTAEHPELIEAAAEHSPEAGGEEFLPKGALGAIDLNVLFLLIGMMVIVNTLSDTGVFEWLAIMLARLAKGNGMLITIFFMVMTAVLSAFLDNVTTVILMAPITILLCQLLEMPAPPILIMEAVFSNIGGTSTLVGDPPNILIGSQSALTFNDFLINLGPPVLIMMVVLLGVMFLILRKSIKTTEATRKRVETSRPDQAILEPGVLKKALVVFALVLAGFFAGHALEIEPGIIALAGAMVMVLVCKKNIHHALMHVEWNTILFFAGLFMMIAALEHHGVFEAMGQYILKICGGDPMKTTLILLWFAALASAILDNIPLVMAMIPLVKGISPELGYAMGADNPLLWALALGACLGGNGTMIGASANVVIAQIANRNNCRISFMGFTKYGFPFMLASLAIAHAYLYFRFFMHN
ncbi:MAG: ArsB/NhaD family transporter [Pontiellaceae bacterium]|nr:ArsB/NhaD family transporter [Pontiellaceae bacterium]MBN2784353.1 ArsB/NhaD family transporter [Pontiellaceae bacterium]